MKKLNCIIVEDEPLAANILEKYIHKIDHLVLVGKAENAVSAFNLLNEHQVDVMFLDIKMPQISGLELIQSLRKPPPNIIFTTAFRDFALEGFDLGVVDYLLKPISFERFLKSVSKIPQDSVSAGVVIVESEEQNYIFVREDKKMKKVMLMDILFIESIKDYVKIILKNDSVLSYIKMSYLENRLPPSMFIRTHKSYIINVHAIDTYNANEIEIANTSIPIGRFYKQLVHQTLEKLTL